jgi:hypothetical protein
MNIDLKNNQIHIMKILFTFFLLKHFQNLFPYINLRTKHTFHLLEINIYF